MKITSDNRNRVKLPDQLSSIGDVFDCSTDSQGRIVLRKLTPTPATIENIPIVRPIRKGRLLVAPRPPARRVDYAALMREERDAR